MKHLLYAFILCCFALHGCVQPTRPAQQIEQEHLKFKGVPIIGSFSSFCDELQKKGLTIIDAVADSMTNFKFKYF